MADTAYPFRYRLPRIWPWKAPRCYLYHTLTRPKPLLPGVAMRQSITRTESEVLETHVRQILRLETRVAIVFDF